MEFSGDAGKYIQSSVFLFYSVKILSEAAAIIGLFLPIVALVHKHPHVIVLNETFSVVWVATTALLLFGLVLDLSQPDGWTVKSIIFTQIFSGIAFYRLFPILRDYIMMMSILAIFSFFAWMVVSGYDISGSVKESARYSAAAMIFGATWGILASYFFIPELAMAIAGFYLVLKTLVGRLDQLPDRVGMGDTLYYSAWELSDDTMGVMVLCIVYLAIYSTAFIYSAYVVPFVYNSGIPLTVYSLALNGSWILSFIFYSQILLFWLRLLPRLTESIDFWRDGFDKSAHVSPPSRPTVYMLLVPFVGWFLSRLPTWDIAAHTPLIAYKWNEAILLLLVSLEVTLILAGILLWVAHSRIDSRFTSDQGIQSDSKVIGISAILLAIMVRSFSLKASILVLLVTGVLYTEIRYGTKSNTYRLVYALVLASSTVVIPLLWEFQGEISTLNFWQIIVIFLAANLLVHLHTNSELVFQKITS